MTEAKYLESPTQDELESLGCNVQVGVASVARDVNGTAIAWKYYTKNDKGQYALEWHWDTDVVNGGYKPRFRTKAAGV
jgi:hypothetical protein